MPLKEIEANRKIVSGSIKKKTKSSLGQFFTPMHIASFMASFFSVPKGPIYLLDPGAGIGSLSSALAHKFYDLTDREESIEITAFEVDDTLIQPLGSTLESIGEFLKERGVSYKTSIVQDDFILYAGRGGSEHSFTHAIINPPYKKIGLDSGHRLALRKLGIESVNLYSGFVAVALSYLQEGGELVAIIPRSFCNGTYFLPFRRYLLENCCISKIHLFTSRSEAFSEEEVLQENVIIHLVKGKTQTDVIISKSTNTNFDDLTNVVIPFDRIVKLNDKDKYFHIPEGEVAAIELLEGIKYTLMDLSIDVSTGPVVDFRMKKSLLQDLTDDSVPLLYSNHFGSKEIVHPVVSKKPNAILNDIDTNKWLSPTGFYTLIKRFSSKEEKQRIVARVLNPENVNSKFIGIENHLNYLHAKKQPLEKTVAYGLAAYLNASLVDTFFRQFSGHTQVNATDLRQMLFPSLDILNSLGKWAMRQSEFHPTAIDSELKRLLM